MNDQQAWCQALESAKTLYGGLPVETRTGLDAIIKEIMGLKEELAERVLCAGSADICRACAGQCCMNGKYHFTLLDLFAYMSSDTEPVAPHFSTGTTCPYSGDAGCLMPPRFRPMTCVVFNCDPIEERIGPDGRSGLYACEKQLRDAITSANRITGQRVDRALLLTGDA